MRDDTRPPIFRSQGHEAGRLLGLLFAAITFAFAVGAREGTLDDTPRTAREGSSTGRDSNNAHGTREARDTVSAQRLPVSSIREPRPALRCTINGTVHYTDDITTCGGYPARLVSIESRSTLEATR